jgi:NAD+ synthetase
MRDFCWDAKSMAENIVERSIEHLKLHAADRKTLVLGVSGGADSALVAALASMVCAKTGLQLVGRSMPTGSTTKEELDRSVLVGEAFCDDFAVSVSLDEIFYPVAAFLENWSAVKDPHKVKVRHGNIKARLRMICLYNLAHAKDGVVLSTDNYTEWLLGFWTEHGDVGNFGMIQNMWKSEVYNVMEYLVRHVYNSSDMKKQAAALRACIDALPTDGLGVSKSDFDQIFPEYDPNASAEANYKEVDRLLFEHAVCGNRMPKDCAVMKQHIKTMHKRNDPFNIPREHILHEPFYIHWHNKMEDL